MGDVLVYVDPAVNGRLLAFARPLADAAGGALVALVASREPVAAGALDAADVVLEVTHPALEPYLPEAHQAVLAAAIAERSPDVVVVENTTAGYDLGAAAAAAADLPFVGYCLDVSVDGGEAEATCAIYGGQLHATVRAPLPAVLAVNSVALHEEPQPSGAAERVQLAPPPQLGNLRSSFVEAVAEPSEGGVDLASADLIVCVGRGIGGAENIEIAEELASALRAELGASRPVIDSGWVPKARQIGKSGATVKPKLYLGLGVSGAPEHVEGMQGSELIVAVNTDPGAAIFNIAHYGAVADLFDVADELTSLLG
jgi:electron transfer flavoprotein alpha subunit